MTRHSWASSPQSPGKPAARVHLPAVLSTAACNWTRDATPVTFSDWLLRVSHTRLSPVLTPFPPSVRPAAGGQSPHCRWVPSPPRLAARRAPSTSQSRPVDPGNDRRAGPAAGLAGLSCFSRCLPPWLWTSVRRETRTGSPGLPGRSQGRTSLPFHRSAPGGERGPPVRPLAAEPSGPRAPAGLGPPLLPPPQSLARGRGRTQEAAPNLSGPVRGSPRGTVCRQELARTRARAALRVRPAAWGRRGQPRHRLGACDPPPPVRQSLRPAARGTPDTVQFCKRHM